MVNYFTACGGNYSNSSGEIRSPNYPNQYPGLADCVFLISQSNGTYFNISMLHMDIVCGERTSDFIEFKDGKYEDSPLMGKFCGNDTRVSSMLMSTQNHLRIR